MGPLPWSQSFHLLNKYSIDKRNVRIIEVTFDQLMSFMSYARDIADRMCSRRRLQQLTRSQVCSTTPRQRLELGKVTGSAEWSHTNSNWLSCHGASGRLAPEAKLLPVKEQNGMLDSPHYSGTHREDKDKEGRQGQWRVISDDLFSKYQQAIESLVPYDGFITQRATIHKETWKLPASYICIWRRWPASRPTNYACSASIGLVLSKKRK